jgi:flavin reductase (DIM6/NTAB) family NADH-FMN oxidoreductase RutF
LTKNVDDDEADDYDRLRRKVLWLLRNGLYVVGTRSGPQRNLMTVSWVTQVATSPKLVGMGVERTALTHRLTEEGRIFALSILSRSDRSLVRKFVKPVSESSFDETTGRGTMNGVAVRAERTGAPVLEVALAWIDCEVRHALALGSHSWFVGEVVGCGSAEIEERSSQRAQASDDLVRAEVLRMEDTRMNYGG